MINLPKVNLRTASSLALVAFTNLQLWFADIALLSSIYFLHFQVFAI
jgi:hypothetical protein